MEYAKCLVEVDEILKYLSKEDLKKIPDDIRTLIKEKKDKQYVWKYDESKNLGEQNLNRQTIAILSYLNMEYMLGQEEKRIMQQLHKLNEERAEKEKAKLYNVDDLFKNRRVKENQEELSLVEIKKEKWYQRIFSFIIKKILKK